MEKLLLAIFVTPEDKSSWLVYADYLMSKNDKMGEWLSFCLQGYFAGDIDFSHDGSPVAFNFMFRSGLYKAYEFDPYGDDKDYLWIYLRDLVIWLDGRGENNHPLIDAKIEELVPVRACTRESASWADNDIIGDLVFSSGSVIGDK